MVNTIGWVLSLLGTAIWLFGYFTTGTQSLAEWPNIVPDWIAAYLPNLESEIGFALMIVGSVLAYWPSRTVADARGSEPR